MARCGEDSDGGYDESSFFFDLIGAVPASPSTTVPIYAAVHVRANPLLMDSVLQMLLSGDLDKPIVDRNMASLMLLALPHQITGVTSHQAMAVEVECGCGFCKRPISSKEYAVKVGGTMTVSLTCYLKQHSRVGDITAASVVARLMIPSGLEQQEASKQIAEFKVIISTPTLHSLLLSQVVHMLTRHYSLNRAHHGAQKMLIILEGNSTPSTHELRAAVILMVSNVCKATSVFLCDTTRQNDTVGSYSNTVGLRNAFKDFNDPIAMIILGSTAIATSWSGVSHILIVNLGNMGFENSFESDLHSNMLIARAQKELADSLRIKTLHVARVFALVSGPEDTMYPRISKVVRGRKPGMPDLRMLYLPNEQLMRNPWAAGNVRPEAVIKKCDKLLAMSRFNDYSHCDLGPSTSLWFLSPSTETVASAGPGGGKLIWTSTGNDGDEETQTDEEMLDR